MLILVLQVHRGRRVLALRQNPGAKDFSREPHILQMGREDVSSPGSQPAGLALSWLHESGLSVV